MRISVDLPAPLGPSSPSIPRSTSKETPESGVTGPGYTFTRSRTASIVGSDERDADAGRRILQGVAADRTSQAFWQARSGGDGSRLEHSVGRGRAEDDRAADQRVGARPLV